MEPAKRKVIAAKVIAQSARPTAAECVAVCDALAAVHGRPSEKRHVSRVGCEIQEPHTVLDSLVRTILSQNTTDVTSQRAFSSLKAAFPDWESVRTAPPGTVEEAIRVGGLADIKAARIKAILNSLLQETGSLSLEHLRSLPCEQVKAQLTQFKGVGPKTVACVLMFCMGRAEFPVDTHVWEISKQLGWVPGNASREETYEHLNVRVPDHIKYDLHVLMVQHGKVCPACGKRGTPQKRRAAAAVPCPLAVHKRRKGSSKDLIDDVLVSDKPDTERDQDDAACHRLKGEIESAAAVSSSKRLKQRQQQVGAVVPLPAAEADVNVKVEPQLLDVKLEVVPTLSAVLLAEAGSAAAAAAAAVAKPEPVPAGDVGLLIKQEQSVAVAADVVTSANLGRVLRPRKCR